MGRADGLVTYLNDAWTPYHAVLATCEALRARGYEELDERDAWSLRRGGKYFYTRNASACVAFAQYCATVTPLGGPRPPPGCCIV